MYNVTASNNTHHHSINIPLHTYHTTSTVSTYHNFLTLAGQCTRLLPYHNVVWHIHTCAHTHIHRQIDRCTDTNTHNLLGDSNLIGYNDLDLTVTITYTAIKTSLSFISTAHDCKMLKYHVTPIHTHTQQPQYIHRHTDNHYLYLSSPIGLVTGGSATASLVTGGCMGWSCDVGGGGWTTGWSLFCSLSPSCAFALFFLSRNDSRKILEGPYERLNTSSLVCSCLATDNTHYILITL